MSSIELNAAEGELSEETVACGTHYLHQYTAEVRLIFWTGWELVVFLADVDTLMRVADSPAEELSGERAHFPAWEFQHFSHGGVPRRPYVPSIASCAAFHAAICSFAKLLLYWGWPSAVLALEDAALIKSPLNLAFARWLLAQRRVVVGRAVKPLLSRPRKDALPS